MPYKSHQDKIDCQRRYRKKLKTRANIPVSRTPEYKIWAEMIRRCTNSNSSNYHNYGGRGINVCKRWLDSFSDFLFDMGLRPADNYTIERKNNNDDYVLYNVEWIHKDKQRLNKRSSVVVEVNGVIRTVSEWAKISDITRTTLYARAKRGITGPAFLRDPDKIKSTNARSI